MVLSQRGFAEARRSGSAGRGHGWRGHDLRPGGRAPRCDRLAGRAGRAGDRHPGRHLRGRWRAGGERGRVDHRAGRPGPPDRGAGGRPRGPHGGGGTRQPRRGTRRARPAGAYRRGRLALRPGPVPVHADRPGRGHRTGRRSADGRLVRRLHPAAPARLQPAARTGPGGGPGRGAAAAAAERGSLLHGGAARLWRGPLPLAACRAAAAGRVRHGGRGGPGGGGAR